jgi:hypothetical protein
MSFFVSLLLFLVLVRYILPRVLRLVLGSFVRQQVHKAQQGGFYPPTGGQTGAYQTQAQDERATPPGQVRVAYVPPTPAKGEHKHEFRGGEYVDYEEVK